MDWLILILGVPAILIPLVLLLGFAGCPPAAFACVTDADCPVGTVCVDGACLAAPLAPENLAAIARDDHSVSLTWSNIDPAATDFRIERAPEGDDFAAIPAPADLSPAGATDASGLQEGVTFIYRVRSLEGQAASEPSDPSSATVLPLAPVNFLATPVAIDQIDLSWTNASAIATEFSVEHRVPGGVFAEIRGSRGAATTFSHRSLAEGSTHEYRVFAIVVDGVENSQRQDVKSAASAVASATIAFTPVFTAPQGTLINEGNNEGFCLVQRLPQTLLTASGATPTHQVRILLRGPLTRSLTLDRVTISKAAPPGPTVDLYDSDSDLIDVASGVTIAANAAVTVGPVNYTLDFARDLIVAFDVSSTAGQGNVRFGGLPGAHAFSNPGTAEAGVPDRTTGYANDAPDILALIEKIEVL